MYNILAAGRPMIAVAGRDSDLASAVERHQLGWVVTPGDTAALTAAIAEARRDPAGVAARGAHGRQTAERNYQYRDVMRAFVDLFDNLLERRMADHRA
jgi:glycosyltransferase involved in cell wall biosynthesis